MDKVYCPGCVFGFWYNWGVMQNYDITRTYFMAVSGSALAAVSRLCELDLEKQLLACDALRPRLVSLNLHAILLTWLHNELPEDCHQKCNGKLCILVRKLSNLRVVEVTTWKNKQHLIDTLIAACSPFIPYAIDNVYFIDCVRTKCPDEYVTLPQSSFRWLPPTKDVARELFYQGKNSTVVD